MPAQRVHQHGPLPHQQLTRPMQHQHGLLFGRLDRHEPHARPGYRLADRFGVGRVRLAALDIKLDVVSRHKPRLVAQRLDFACPMVRCAAHLDTDQAGRQTLEERQHLCPLQLATCRNHLSSSSCVHSDSRLGKLASIRAAFAMPKSQWNRVSPFQVHSSWGMVCKAYPFDQIKGDMGHPPTCGVANVHKQETQHGSFKRWFGGATNQTHCR